MKNISKILLILGSILFCFGCSLQKEDHQTAPKIELLEIRITRTTALEGGETLLLRKINKDWSAVLLGDGYRFSCLYQKSVRPKSDWEDVWQELQTEGLLEIPDGRRLSHSLDGNQYKVEINYQNGWKLYSFDSPNSLKTKESEQIQNIGNLVSREFETPMFSGNYERGEIGNYLIEQCKTYAGQDSIH